MSPVFTHRRDRVYRYYVSSSLQRGADPTRDDTLRRVPAPPLETLVAGKLAALTRRAADPLEPLRRVEVRSTSLHLILAADAACDVTLDQLARRLAPGERALDDGDAIRVVLPTRFQTRGGRTAMLSPQGASAEPPRVDPRLVQSLRSAHDLRRQLERGDVLVSTHARRLVEIAYLAPELQRAILDGRQPPGLAVKDLLKMSAPLLWSAQLAALTRP